MGNEYDIVLTIGNNILKRVHEEYHIGHLLSDGRNLVDHRNTIIGLGTKTNCINRTFPCVGIDAKRMLFKSQCCCFYGIELIDVNSIQFSELLVKWRKCVRSLLNLHLRTHNYLIPYLVESSNIEFQIYSRILSFFYKGFNHKSEYISFFFRNCLHGLYSYMSKNLYSITNRLDININVIFYQPLNWVKRKCKPVLDNLWNVNLLQELLLCREGTLDCELSPEQITDLIVTLCTD